MVLKDLYISDRQLRHIPTCVEKLLARAGRDRKKRRGFTQRAMLSKVVGNVNKPLEVAMSGRPDRDSMIHTYAIRITTTAIAFLALLMMSSVAQAQVLYGSLTGTVTDKAGAVIPNVAVTIANQQTGDLRSTKARSEERRVGKECVP